MIHHFKNYVIRGDGNYREQAAVMLNEGADLLQRYAQQSLNPKEKQALQAIQDTFASYRQRLELAQQLVGQSLTPEAIDAQVSVDDAPALSALQVLLREGIADGENDAKRVYGALNSARALAYSNLLVSLLMALFLVAAAWWLIRHRIVVPILRLTGAMGRLASDELDTPIPEIGEHNEIGKMASALRVFKENAHARQLAEVELRAVLDNAMDGIIVIDSSGQVRSANPAACALFGYEVSELLGQNVKMLMPEEIAQRHDGYLQAYLQTGKAHIIGTTRELEGEREDGERFPLELGITEIRRAEDRMFVGMLRDITERKRLERMKSEFVSTVSHELRTPLTSILGSLGLIRGGAAGELTDQSRQMVEIAHNSAERLVRLINDILDTEKIESGRMQFQMEALDLMTLLERSIEENRGYGERHGVGLVWQRGHPRLEVLGDRDRLLQVMANLLSNAIKYSPRGDDVRIGLEAHDGSVTIRVTDHGPGIPEEFHERIFMRFSQADSSDTREKGGTGLGLAISKAIVERHGGKIGFETRAGEGTTFYVTLPRVAHHRAPAVTGQSIGRVLVCEDDRDVAALLQMILREGGIDSDVAYDAEHAKALLTRNDYLAMTLDLMLPGQDGISLLRELREAAATHDLPVVVVSAKASEGRDELNGGAVNIVDWMNKPIDAERLLADLRGLACHEDNRPRILHVEDDPDVASVVQAVLEEVAEVEVVATLAEARRQLASDNFQLVILDLTLPDGNGEELLPLLRHRTGGSIPVVVFSASEMEADLAESVSKALVKSLTSNEQLLDSILQHIGYQKDRGKHDGRITESHAG